MQTLDPKEAARGRREAAILAGESRHLSVPLAAVGGTFGSARIAVAVPPSFRRMGGRDLPAPGHRVFRIPTAEAGDERYSWDGDDFDQIREAKEFFDRMVAEGMVPFRVGKGGVKSDSVMHRFDPAAEEVVFAPLAVPRAVVGG